MEINWEQNQERAGFIHAAEASMSIVAPGVSFNPDDLFGFILAAWTPDCDWSPIDAAADFATAIISASNGE